MGAVVKHCGLCGHAHTARELAARGPKGDLGAGVLLYDCVDGCRNTFAVEAAVLAAVPAARGAS